MKCTPAGKEPGPQWNVQAGFASAGNLAVNPDAAWTSSRLAAVSPIEIATDVSPAAL
jgi:hypothetical protein